MAAQKRKPRRAKVPGEAYLYERTAADGSRVFEVGWRDHDRRQHWRTVEGGIMAARAERDRIMGDRANGRAPTEPKLTFGKAARSWLAALEDSDRDERTVAERRRHVARLSGWHTRRLDSITVADLRKLRAKLRDEGLGARSRTLYMNTVRQVYRHAAAELHWRGDDPTRNLDRDRSEGRTRHAIFRGELGQVIDAAHEPYRTVFLTMAWTGCRISEALGLALDDLILDDDPRVSFRFQLGPRGERKRLKTDDSEGVVPIPEQLAAELRAHLERTAERGTPGEFVFATRTGRELSRHNVARELRRAQLVAKRPDGRRPIRYCTRAASWSVVRSRRCTPSATRWRRA